MLLDAEMADRTTVERGSPSARVVRWLNAALAGGELVPGEPLPSERDLALRLGVSRVTVRATLQRLASQGLVRQPGKGCAWRAGVRSGERSANDPLAGQTVAVIGARRIQTPLPEGYESSIHAQAVHTLEEAELHVLAVNLKALDRGYEDAVARWRPAGLLLTYDAGESPEALALAEACRAQGVPVVVYGGGERLEGFDRVDSDHEAGGYAVARHLIDVGCRRLLCFWRFSAQHVWVRQREAGVERALREAGLPPSVVVRTPELGESRYESELGFRHMARTLAGYLCDRLATPEGAVDGIVTATDRHAIQTSAALRFLGRAPEHAVHVAGYDNYWSGCVERAWEPEPPAVTVDKDNARIGTELARLLLARMNAAREVSSPPAAAVRIVAPRLVPTKGGARPSEGDAERLRVETKDDGSVRSVPCALSGGNARDGAHDSDCGEATKTERRNLGG